ncbi:MAG: fused DSP-PTPase phosphatase/NAD kinase-like protein, partial [Candidatus Saccharimonadales bacterium]
MIAAKIAASTLLACIAWLALTGPVRAQAMNQDELDKVLRGPDAVPNSTVQADRSEAVGDDQGAPALRGEMPTGSAQTPADHSVAAGGSPLFGAKTPGTRDGSGGRQPAVSATKKPRHKRAVDSQAEMPPLAPGFQRPTIYPTVNYQLLQSLTNFHTVSPFLLRGGQPTADDLAKLKSAGVKTVIDLRNEEVLVRQEAMQARALGLSFASIPLDVFNPPSQKAVQEFMSAVSDS